MLRFTAQGNAVYEPDGAVLTGFFWDRSKFACIQGPIGCLSAETEYLTSNGWRRIDQYGGEEIMVWHPDGAAWFESPKAYVNLPCAEMWHFRNEHSLSMMLSDEHRMPLIDRKGKFRVRLASKVAIAPGRYEAPTGFTVANAGFDEAKVRLSVAIAADGCLPKRGNQVVFCVRKDRKKDRLRALFIAAGIMWKEFPHSTRQTELTFVIQRQDWMKKVFAPWGSSTELCDVVIDEMPHWDGLFEGEDIRFDGTCQETAEFMQYAAHATGRRATISVRTDSRGKDWNPVWTVNISHRESAKTKVGIRSDSIKVDRVASPDGRKYCFTTSTGFFIARHNGRVFCTGNSGTSTCSCHKIWALAGAQQPDQDGVRRTRWIITRDTYKELRETTVKTWLEWFPEDQWGQFIRSEPMLHHLKRDHPSGDGTKIDCEVIFLAIPDADVAEAVLASYEITGFFRNEGQFCEKEVVDELLSRCSRYPSMRNGPGPTWFGGWMDMNAPIEGHWVPYMRGDVPLPPEMSDDEKAAYDRPDDWVFLVQPPGLLETFHEGKPVYSPNPLAENQKYLIEPYMEKIKGKKKSWIDRRVLNKVGIRLDGKPVYPTFSEEDHVHKHDKDPVQGLSIVVGLDFGRAPAAGFMQEVNGLWTLHSELIGENESAELFAPRVKKHLARFYPNMPVEFWGDPRGSDKGQNDETTAYDIFQKHGMRVLNATEDNNVELRRSTVESVLNRRNGFKVNPTCTVFKRGMAGGYAYRKIKGVAGMYSPKPVKNDYSHIVEAVENGLIGGGEGFTVVRAVKSVPKPKVKARTRFRLRA
jgi:hypothetical protein